MARATFLYAKNALWSELYFSLLSATEILIYYYDHFTNSTKVLPYHFHWRHPCCVWVAATVCRHPAKFNNAMLT